MKPLLTALPFFFTAFILSFIFTPITKRIGFSTNVYAVENNRTVHHGKIVRIGGVAIFISFMITMAIFVKVDDTIKAVLVGGLIVFVAGLIDDIYNLKPIVKFGLQIIGALYTMVFGNVSIVELNLSFIHLDLAPISFFITLLWIVGVTNAINLIDGLDGLSCGISIIVLCSFGFIAYNMGRRDMCIIALILIGAISGFLPFNFHPASIFVGDSGALFMGYMIACLSLMGFKTTTVVSLVLPLIILFIPLADTSLAIIRRKVSGHKISEADRSHLHHVLMYKIGLSHRNVVLLLYLVTLLFGSCAVIMYFNSKIGILVLFVLCLLAWVFIELTGMINPKFHPLIGLSRRIFGKPIKTNDAFFEANKLTHKEGN